MFISTHMLQNSYALCDLGVSIIKRVTENQGELQESTHVVLPPVLYSTLEKKDENGLLVCLISSFMCILAVFFYYILQEWIFAPLELDYVLSVLKASHLEVKI